MSWTNENLTGVLEQLAAKSATDESFRKLCVDDVRAAVRQLTGDEIPENLKINVVDSNGYHINLVLPQTIQQEGELSELELASVAGGSKSGANDFFNGMAGGVSLILGANPNQHADNAEGTAGNIIGQIISAPIKILG